MVLDLKRIFVNENISLPIEYSFDLSDVDVSGIHPLEKPVKFNGTVQNKASMVELYGVITYVYKAPCDRCGEIAEHTHTVEIKKALAVSVESEESDNIILTPDMKLDLYGLVYSEVVTDLPMKHLCKSECKGICPKCGKNLNNGECGCVKKEIDPRLSALAELLNN